MDNPQATDFEIGWFAGIVDGEGWLGMTVYNEPRITRGLKTKVKCELKITNCDEEIILKSAEIMRKMGVNPYLRTSNGHSKHSRLVHECATKHMTTVERILLVIRDYLVGIKQERADLILRFIELRRVAPELTIEKDDYPETGRYHGARTFKVKPYTEEELQIIEACRELQSRGASETTREDRDKAVKALRSAYASRYHSKDAASDMI